MAALWRKISARRLLAVIGPSGVGKSSLLRAGVAPRAPPGWRVVVFTPGEAPTLELARALAPDHTGDPAAMARLLGLNDTDTALAVVSRWRGQFDEAVLVVDQFEELFTLNPPEVQASFIELLRRLVDAADVHLVLAIRDDYLYRCQEFEQIAPIFKDLTPLPPPTPEGLRRALKEPAARQLYRFESELLVDRMIAEVEGERGALPLMAFAVHRLWEERDREERLLTEAAYEHIGGVAGALAQHAEATLERIGFERLPIVRELFRNLVTAEGTRTVREVDELLSVFSDSHRESPEEVLRQLIDARLVTAYRINEDEGSLRRVEIIHESLLSSWPRLVRWQTQDADSARLRDELRQAARLWDDHERASDYLWTGKAFRAFSVWREDYPGGLTDLEEEFAEAMTSYATLRRRQRRIAGAAVMCIAAAVAVVFGLLWRRSVQETRRAEAAKLLALGQLRLDDYPTATLAHTIASLELADTAEARRLALRALWEGPTAFVINRDASHATEFTPDGEWLVQSIQMVSQRQVGIVAKDGSRTDLDQVFGFELVDVFLNPEGTVLFSKPELESGSPQQVVLWSIPDGRRLADVKIAPPAFVNQRVMSWNRDRFLALVWENRAGARAAIFAFNFDGTHRRLGTLALDVEPVGWSRRVAMDLRTGRWVALVENETVWVHEVGAHDLSEPRVLGRHDGSGHRVAVDPEGRLVVTSSSDGMLKIWDLTTTSPPVVIQGPEGVDAVEFFKVGPRLAARTVKDGTERVWVYSFADGEPRLLRTFHSGETFSIGIRPSWGWDAVGRRYAKNAPDGRTRLWSLAAPADADPLFLRRGEVGMDWWHSFHPNGKWLATADTSGLMVWPLGRPYPSVIRSHQKPVWSVTFGPQGQWLASGCSDGIVRLTPVDGEVPDAGRVVDRLRTTIRGLAASADGATLMIGGENWGAKAISLDGNPGFPIGDLWAGYGLAYSPDGRLAAVTGRTVDDRYVLQVFSTDTHEQIAETEPDDGFLFGAPRFLDDRHVAFTCESGLDVSDVATGTTDRLFEGKCLQFAVSDDGRRIGLVELSHLSWMASGRAVFLDLEPGTRTHLASHGDQLSAIAMDAAGTMVVTGDKEGVLRVGPTSGEEPHLLFGHQGRIWAVAIDPVGRWIATGGADATVRIWPMPDLSKPPLHTLPRNELIAKLRSLTNLRVVRDGESPAGWTLTHEPFPGWETVPTW